VVEVTVGGPGQLQRSEADVVQRLVVDAVSLVRVFYQLVDGQSGVVVGHAGLARPRPLVWTGTNVFRLQRLLEDELQELH